MSTRPSSPEPLRTAEQAGAFLESLIRPAPRPYAERASYAQQAIRKLLDRVGHPERRLPVIHIAGSKGKGSTALLIEAILRAAGRRVGTFTSPHLQRWTERYRIDGLEVEGSRFAAALETLRPAIEALQAEHPDHPPSFFDAATALALLLFGQAGVDYAIMETGLGGRLDATTVVQPSVTCITTLELEHTDKLGHTLTAIARGKAGIIKTGVPVVAGELPPPALAEVAARAQALDAPLVRLGSAWQYAVQPRRDLALDVRIWNPDLSLSIDATLPVLGRHLAHNAALAVACVQQLHTLDPGELALAVQRGFAQVQLPARTEILSRSPWVVVDSAHTPDSAQALAQALARIPAQPLHLLLSLSAGKDPDAICAPLLPGAASVILTRAEPLRALPPDTLAARLRQRYPASLLHIIPDPVCAVHYAWQTLPPEALLCITGSVYMAGLGRGCLPDFAS